MSDLTARAREWALLLTSWPSVSSTADEAGLPTKLAEQLQHFDRAWTAPIPGDPFQRSNVFAVKRGKSRRAIVLTGHFDTVPFDDYGALAELALDPLRLKPAVIKALKASGEHPLALADLESGEFIPGRGLFDMKAGLAAGIAVMEAYDGELSLIFLGVSDEEERSAGARAAVLQLKALAEEEGLEIALIINLDSISDQGDGSTGRVVTYGSIGKQLLFAHVVGKQAHAGFPQDGVNAAYVMSELVRAIELSPMLSETTGQEVAAPPSTLFAKDLKQGYNVTSPHQAHAYWNTMQHKRSGTEVLAIATDLARGALAEVERKTGHRIAFKNFAALGAEAALQDAALSLPDQTLAAMVQCVARAKIKEPTVVLGFGSIPYPAVVLRNDALRSLIAKAVGPYELGHVNYFAGISDVSFYGEASGDLSVVAANTPIWGKGFVMPEPAGYPTINIGPWGRDYHTWLERVHAPYAFETLPRVLLSVIDALAKEG
jgi:arginine utilization protein RocB